MKLKLASKSDIRFIYNLYNYYVKKNLFLNQNQISYKTHLAWVKKNKLKNIFIGLKERKKVGYIRYDLKKKNLYELSIAIKHNFIGKGYGSEILRQSSNYFLKKNKLLFAYVKKTNIKSLKFFLKNNFKKIKSKKINIKKNINYSHFCVLLLKKN